jgi:hypothetical protein
MEEYLHAERNRSALWSLDMAQSSIAVLQSTFIITPLFSLVCEGRAGYVLLENQPSSLGKAGWR